MHLEGSCHCRSVRFSVESPTPQPFMQCYCSICRKTGGGGGFAVNLGGDAKSLQVQGREHLRVYHARLEDGSQSPAERNFCGECGSALWLFDARWPDLIHPMAAAIDTPLPVPPERVRIMLASKPQWVDLPAAQGGQRYADFEEYPQESLEDWHKRHRLLEQKSNV